MADTEGTPSGEGTAQAGAEAGGESTPPAANTGTGAPDKVSLLESRLNGLEARLRESGSTRANAEKARDEAIQKLADYESGKLKDNEAFQAELKRERDRAAAAETTARLARIEAKFPETYSVLGEATAAMSDEQLAGVEARMTGTPAAEGEPPAPRNPTEQRPAPGSPGTAQQEESLDSMRARFRASTAPWLT